MYESVGYCVLDTLNLKFKSWIYFSLNIHHVMLQIFSRSKNTVNILIKNWLDMCIGAVVYWAFGFGLTFGTDQGRFIGTTYFFFHEMAGKVWIKGGLISKIIQEITVPQLFHQNLKFEGQWFCTFFEEPPL